MKTAMQRIGMIAGAAVLVLVVAWFLVLFHPESKKLTTAHAAKAAAEQQASQLQSQVANLNSLVALVPADRQKLTALQALLPDNPQLPAALDQLQAIASSTGVVLQSVNPSVPASGASAPPSSGPPAVTLAMTAGGSYPQEMAFVNALDRSPRSFVVDHLSIAPAGPGKMTMQLSARMFYAGQPTP
jgi:Tfp pilus assembly protein PilO